MDVIKMYFNKNASNPPEEGSLKLLYHIQFRMNSSLQKYHILRFCQTEVGL